jgi:pyrimidine-nucleoside phosphorylase
MVTPVAFIDAKRTGAVHSADEITAFVSGFVSGTIPDYQVSAWLMAVCCQGLTLDETVALTEAYVASGDMLDLSGLSRPCVDKHSTGGVGDKITLILAPILAACGLGVAKLSGRGLGLTGGTVDKLEAIPGFKTDLSKAAFLAQIDRIGLAVASQTAELAPADGRTYALRDVTATVASIPLIAASVMSKKIAAGAPVITLDVKYGSGAFMATREEAEQLAQTCVAIGERCGRTMRVHLTDMNTPLGEAVGNANEVAEAIAVLQGIGPKDVWELTLELAVMTLLAAGVVTEAAEAEAMVEATIVSGWALKAFEDFVVAQGGDPECVRDVSRLPQPAHSIRVCAKQSVRVTQCDAKSIAHAALALGAGRLKKGDMIDPAVGLVVHKKPGDSVQAEDALVTLQLDARETGRDEAVRWVEAAYGLPIVLQIPTLPAVGGLS